MHSRASGEAARGAKRGRQPLPSRAISHARGHVRISCFARRTTEKRETARSLPHTGFKSLAAKQVSLRSVKHKTCTDFVALSRTTLYFLQPATTWFVARQLWFVGDKTCNITIQLVLQKFCKIRCTILYPPTQTFLGVRHAFLACSRYLH